MQTYDFTLFPGCSPQAVAETVRTHGVAHIPGYLDPSMTRTVAAQCRALLDADEPWITRLKYSLGRSVRVERDRIQTTTEYTTVHATYSSTFMRGVADEFMEGRAYLFNYDLYVAYDVEGSHHFAHRLHYDRVPHLKFFIYLTDVTDQTGPLLVVSSSHRFALEAQAANRSTGNVPTEEETRIVPEEYKSHGVRILGRTGTLIVFNSDIVHAATHIVTGERLVIRSRCIESRHLEAVHHQLELNAQVAPLCASTPGG